MENCNKTAPNNDDQPIADYTKCIKQENYDEDNDIERIYIHNDVTKVKREDLGICYPLEPDPLDNFMKVEADMEVTDELKNNLLRSSNTECCTTETDNSETLQKDPLEIVMCVHKRTHRGVNLSSDTKKLIIDKFNNGEKQISIGKQLNLHRSIISKTIANFNKRQSVVSPSKSGRPRKTDTFIDRQIKMMAINNPFTSSTEIKNSLEIERGLNISKSTIKRRLRQVGLRGYRPAKNPFISDDRSATIDQGI